MNASVNGIGHADINVGGAGEVSSSSEVVPPPVADWNYLPNILTGENSGAMVLTSTNLPDGTTTDVVFNGGGIGLVQVIVPGTVAVPEPATAMLLVVGSSLMVLRRRRS